MSARKMLPLAVCAALSFVASHAAFAQDAAVVNAATVQVKLDNASVRVLESLLKPGEKERAHSHPACVIYVIAGGKIRNHLADGTTVDTELVTGTTLYRDPLTHWAENIGTTPIHLIITELKERK